MLVEAERWLSLNSLETSSASIVTHSISIIKPLFSQSLFSRLLCFGNKFKRNMFVSSACHLQYLQVDED